MHKFIEWFCQNYPELKALMQACEHGEDINPYHIEGDCWSHTMMVCKVVELKGFDKVVQLAALLHDIGKPKVRRVNLNNNHVQFFGHEEESAKMAKPILDKLIDDSFITNKESLEVLTLVKLHSEPYKHKNRDSLLELLNNDKQLLNKLLELNESDNLGRFSSIT